MSYAAVRKSMIRSAIAMADRRAQIGPGDVLMGRRDQVFGSWRFITPRRPTSSDCRDDRDVPQGRGSGTSRLAPFTARPRAGRLVQDAARRKEHRDECEDPGPLLRLADRGANGFPAERQMALDRALRYRAVMEWIRELMELAVGMRFQSSAHENPPTLRVIHRREARRSRNMLRDAPRRAGFHAPEV